jgi:hypothetical protein
MLITTNYRGGATVFTIQRNVDKLGCKSDILVLGFLSLHRHDFLDRIYDIKCLEILPELSSLYLCEIKKILDDEIHELS